ncbi:MAG: helix-turn-helix transcriptional regulator [Lachnospiraceae bacterium]|nr:helix-turn-helix transcriptional regulator [Lachnospiraceae bacterium]
MTLGDKITELRRQNGWSQEALAEKLDISRQSVSKWESNSSVPDLDKIIRLSEIFEISTDYLLKEDWELERTKENASNDNLNNNMQIADSAPSLRTLSETEVSNYISLTIEASKKIAGGVALCIFSPVILFLLYGLAPEHLSEKSAGGIGCAVLLLFVAIGVTILIWNGIRLNKYEYLEKEEFALNDYMKAFVEQKRTDFEDTFRKSIALGTALCIIGVIPLMLSSAFDLEDQIYIWCVSLLLIFVACGVWLFVRAGSINECYNKLLQIDDYTPENKQIGKRISWFPGTYWCLATAIYLGISFSFNNWDRSWIIWPVAGVLFAALYQVLRSIVKTKMK